MNKLAVAALVLWVGSSAVYAGPVTTGGTGVGIGVGGSASSNSSLNSTTFNSTNIDARQPYSDGHLFAYPNGFGGYSVLVEPGAPVQPVGPPSCGWQAFIANGQHC